MVAIIWPLLILLIAAFMIIVNCEIGVFKDTADMTEITTNQTTRVEAKRDHHELPSKNVWDYRWSIVCDAGSALSQHCQCFAFAEWVHAWCWHKQCQENTLLFLNRCKAFRHIIYVGHGHCFSNQQMLYNQRRPKFGVRHHEIWTVKVGIYLGFWIVCWKFIHV